jgi:hypothetical protein
VSAAPAGQQRDGEDVFAPIQRKGNPARDPDSRAMEFAALRAEAIRHIQLLAGDTWTDHNLHDPGITILEQMCYGLTELAYRADASIAGHLCGAHGEIDFRSQGLFRPDEILPCRAATPADYRQMLLDRVPGIAEAEMTPNAAAGGSAADIGGLYHLRLRLAAAGPGAPACIRRARDAYRQQRGLGEDLHDAITVMEQRPCELIAEFEVTGPRDPAEVVAEAYQRLAKFISGGVRFQSIEEMLREGATLEQVYTGPAAKFRAVETESIADNTLLVGDLVLALRGIAGLAEIKSLALKGSDGHQNTGAIAWRGDDWVLRLRVPGDGGYAPDVRLSRRGSQVPLDARALLNAFTDLNEAAEPRRRPDDQVNDLLDLPRGGTRPTPAPYYSVQNQFPATYGLGQHGSPAAASPQRRAQIEQLKAYLAVFEQILAHESAQVEHFAKLLSPEGLARRSYWWNVLGDESIPGIEALLSHRAHLIARLYRRYDQPAERRHRALDVQLALYGQTYSQNTMRQFLSYLDTAELDRWLLRNKSAFLRDTVRLSRDRGGGIDYAAGSRHRHALTCGLQRSVSLLLGFRFPTDRPLAAPRRQIRRALSSVEARAGSIVMRIRPDADAPPAARPLAYWPEGRPTVQTGGTATGLRIRPSRVTLPLLRAGLDRRLYQWQHTHGAAGRLLLGPDEEGSWWWLGEFDAERVASLAAAGLRRWLLQINHASEGMHVVEHVLLRPRSADGPHRHVAHGHEFYTLRVTVVFPSWTARTAQQSFREFAEETVRMNCPAHVAAQCLWLGVADMRAFEKDYDRWLAALRKHDAENRESALRLDEASCALIARLSAAAPQANGGGRG